MNSIKIKSSEYNTFFNKKHTVDLQASMSFEYSNNMDTKLMLYSLYEIFSTSHKGNFLFEEDFSIEIPITEYNLFLKCNSIYQQLYTLYSNHGYDLRNKVLSEKTSNILKHTLIVILNSYLDMKLPIDKLENKVLKLLDDPSIISIDVLEITN